MKRLKRNHTYILIALTLFFCWFFVMRHGVFGSKVDWISQHSVLPDYFRTLFYKTGDLFPNFAPDIGGGQNIYHFAYYGLFSPVILFSYLLPFVKMSDYIIVTSILSLAASVVLLYRWLSRKYAANLSFLVSCMFLLAAPMIYHSFNQLMFINYMPFLCMALYGVDLYFEKQKSGLLVSGIFLMILTSFYFSIGGMLVLVLYGISVYISRTEHITARDFLKTGIAFSYRFILAVCMSAFLLVPTFLALRGTRSVKSTLSIGSLLLPDLPVMRLLYSPYGIGLTTIAITVLLTGLLYKKCPERFLSFVTLLILIVPFFGYLLNGGLYIKDKVFLPFLPLLCYLIAHYFHSLKEHPIARWKYILCYVITIGYLYVASEQSVYQKYWKFIILDAVIMLLCFLLFTKWKKSLFLFVPMLLFAFVFHSIAPKESGMILDKEFYNKVTASKIHDNMETVLLTDSGYYRMEQLGTVSENAANLNRIHVSGQKISSMYSSMYNQDYLDFRNQVFQTEQPFRNYLMQSVSANPLFLQFMGVKYIVSDIGKAPTGYKPHEKTTSGTIYVNKNAAPIGYATNQLLAESDYKKLRFPYNQTTLLEHAVVPAASNVNLLELLENDSNIKGIPFQIPTFSERKSQIAKSGNGYRIRSKKTIRLNLPVPEDMDTNKIYFLQFRVINHHKNKDVAITFENERNKLSAIEHPYYNDNKTFTFVTGIMPGQTDFSMQLGKGDYEIQDITCYIGNANQEKNTSLYQDKFQISKEDSIGDRITGNIKASNDGYFISSIPYDKNFVVTIDGHKTDYEKVNTAFIGFPIKKGSHHIEIQYHAKGAFLGQIISILALLSCFFFHFRHHISRFGTP